MYSKISMATSEYLACQLNYSEEKKAVIAYGMENLIFTSLGFLAIILVGWLLGILYEVLWALGAGVLLRKYSGGSHRPTALGCIIFGAVTYPPAVWLAKFIFDNYGAPSWYAVLALGVVIFIIVRRYAPVDSPGKPIVSPEFRKRLHRNSLIAAGVFILASLILVNTTFGLAIMAGLIVQTLSLLPTFNSKEVNKNE